MAKNEELFEVTTMFQMFLKGIAREWNSKGYKLNPNQFKVLKILMNSGPQKVSNLADALCISSAAVTGITDQLLEDGYVKKERGENDRRVVNITLTEKGKAEAEYLQKIQNENLKARFDVLPDEEIQNLKRILSLLNSSL
ncbi:MULTISPECIES: MarR family transcriptional regulator [Bacillus]|uniref:MarR family transcriptional regulator n=1 Tax=Bacillus TaxID=1386 RepID=UPI0002E657A5|nr:MULTISPECIES: MarR family transcriptional regulator [Bacillus]